MYAMLLAVPAAPRMCGTYPCLLIDAKMMHVRSIHLLL